MASDPTSRPGGQQSAVKPPRRFQFIDNTDLATGGASSTQVRRHVMQEYMREKRWETRAKAEDEVLEPDAPIKHSNRDCPPRKRSSQQPQNSSRTLPTNSNLLFVSARVQYDTIPPTKSRSAHGNLPQTLQQNVFPSETCQPHNQAVDCCKVASQRPSTFDRVDSKRQRKRFHLTSQSFAKIADFWPTPPLTPPISLKSEASTSSQCSRTELSVAKNSKSLNPVSALSAARTDPFDCLPMALCKQDQGLFDFYANVMPACSYGFERRNPRAHNWYLSVFIPEAMKSPVAFQNTILVHAANTQAWVRGLTETPLAIEHRARASAMLSNHFQKYPLDISDAAISSTLSAAALEDFDPRVERREYAWLHWRAAVQKIRDRGGPAALEQNLSLRMLINWSDYIFSGYNGLGSTFYFDHKSAKSCSPEQAELIGYQEISQQCEEFLVFLRCTEQLALVAANLQHNPAARQNQMMRYTVFQTDQPLYKLLATPNGPRYTKTGQLKQIISRLAALMTINVAVWEYRYSTAFSEEFFTELLDNVSYNDLDQHISVEALLQILLSGSHSLNLRHTERPWLVGRLLKVAKRLSRASWERLNDFLLQCLTLSSSLSPEMHVWEHELRSEILSAPLASYALPLMQA